MKVSTFEQYLEIEKRRRDWIVNNRSEKDLDNHDKRISENEERRNKFKDNCPFSFTAVLEGVYPEQDYANRWCWQNIGSRQCGECECSSSEYPGCPLVLATEYIKTGWYPNQAGQRVYWSEKAYIEEKVPQHGHKGIWSSYWLGKTGYDYGFTEYYFQNESDRDKFLAAFPIFNTGENYEEKENDMSTMTEKAVHQSKWGFHPVSLAASKKLRFINGVYAKAQRLAGAWERWERKIPSNRVIRRSIRDAKGLKIGMEVVKDQAGNPVPWKEPQVCPLFHVTIPSAISKWSRTDGRAEDNGFGEKILFASRQARIPQPTPKDVLPFPFTEEEIDRLYETAKEWNEN